MLLSEHWSLRKVRTPAIFSRGVKRLFGEDSTMDSQPGSGVSEVLKALQAAGYLIGPDRLHRLGEFGITSQRCGRQFFLDKASVANLRFVLDVERMFGLSRDRDGLTFELACLGYPTVPFERIHRAVATRVRRALAYVNRELRHFDNWSGSTFPVRRIPHVAEKLAKHYVQDAWIAADPKRAVLRDVVQLIFDMLIRASYLNEPFSEHVLVKILFLSGVEENPDSVVGAHNIIALLELARPMLLVGEKNLFLSSVQDDPSRDEVFGTLATVQAMAPLLQLLRYKLALSAAPVAPTYPALPDIPAEEARLAFILQTLTYACAHGISKSLEATERLQAYTRGEAPEIETAVDQLGAMRKLMKSFIEVQYGLPK